jgi:hypothetical protein
MANAGKDYQEGHEELKLILTDRFANDEGLVGDLCQGDAGGQIRLNFLLLLFRTSRSLFAIRQTSDIEPSSRHT